MSCLDDCEKLVASLEHRIIEARKSCITCDRFDETDESCELADQRPPARVIAFGCGQWTPVIPF